MRERPFSEPLEWVGHENRDFLGPEMARSEGSALSAQKSLVEASSAMDSLSSVKNFVKIFPLLIVDHEGTICPKMHIHSRHDSLANNKEKISTAIPIPLTHVSYTHEAKR